MTHVTVIILTRDEALHIQRAIASVQGFAARVIVVDSGSVDATVSLAQQAGAQVLHNPWTTHAQQFNWALDQISETQTWVLRLDADEVVDAALGRRIQAGLPDVEGIYLRRDLWFQGAKVRFGGVSGLCTMRLFRNGFGRAEPRWMDEHIVVAGRTTVWNERIIDHNLKPLDWWIAKHNDYASREVIDLLTQQRDQSGPKTVKRFAKDRLYARLPSGTRAVAYFLYRYVLRGGFRDAPAARRFHVLQGFWYRYLVDAKLAEARRVMRTTGATPAEAIQVVLGHDIPNHLETAA